MNYIYKKKYINNSGDFVYIQVYDNGYSREVPASRPDLILWLQSNTPTEIAYVAPPLPDLETYKNQKKQWLGEESARRCADIDIQRVSGVTEKFTLDVRDSLLARFAELTRKENASALTETEQTEMVYLLSVWEQVKTIQVMELQKKSQVEAAANHATVDAIGWE